MITSEESFNENSKNVVGEEKCFLALFEGKQTNVNLEVLYTMLKQDLKINTNNLDKKLATVLPYMLTFYINNWPGWKLQDQINGINFTALFEEFKQYLIEKLNYLIKSGYNHVNETLFEDKTTTTELLHILKTNTQSSQTESFKQDVAPFTISIRCPPKQMGTLIFTNCGDDLLINSHRELPWRKISEKQLLNWPHVSVQLVSPELSIKRKNSGEYSRSISFINNYIHLPKNIDFIEQIDIVNPTIGRKSYTLKMLGAYIKEYIKLLKYVKVKDFNIIKVLLEEFLTDIEEIEMKNTMATNTSVLFNIGKSIFIRNKTISNDSPADSLVESKTKIRYNEIFIPKMETTLYYFTGIQDLNASDISFSYLNTYKDKRKNLLALRNIIPTLCFSCEFCNLIFNDSISLMEHFEHLHKMEPDYKCRLCKQNCSISQLSANRWRHSCCD